MTIKSSAGMTQAQVQAMMNSTVGAPNAVASPVFATAYQAADPTKPAFINVLVGLAASVNIGSVSNTAELVIGSTSAVSAGTGFLADTYRTDLSVTLINISLTARQALKAIIPAGWFWAIRRTVGTDMSIVSAFDQAMT